MYLVKKTFLSSWLSKSWKLGWLGVISKFVQVCVCVCAAFLFFFLQYVVCFIIESMHYTPALSKINLPFFGFTTFFILSIFQYKHRHRCSYICSPSVYQLEDSLYCFGQWEGQEMFEIFSTWLLQNLPCLFRETCIFPIVLCLSIMFLRMCLPEKQCWEKEQY